MGNDEYDEIRREYEIQESADEDSRLWTDRSGLRDVQYRTDANLAARQSIYAYQHPKLNLPALVLDQVALTGDETVTDIGCGNGAYLAELARRGHTGPVLGVDLSVGMLQAARNRAPAAVLAAGDAAALPLRDEASGLTLAMHMLYHVPDPRAAVRELRRTTRRGGRVLVVLNGEDHLRELRDLVRAALQEITGEEPPPSSRLSLDEGMRLLASEFTSVTRHDFTSELCVPEPGPVADYARSMISAQDLPDLGALAVAVASRVRADQEPFRIRTHTGCLICS
jgi:SAM-dependent methyltransferase